MDWMFVFPQNLYVQILTPSVMVLGDGDFGRLTGLAGGALVNRTSALIRKHMRAYSCSLLFPPCEDTVKAPVWNPEEGPYQILTMLASWPQTSSLQNWEISVTYKPVNLYTI